MIFCQKLERHEYKLIYNFKIPLITSKEIWFLSDFWDDRLNVCKIRISPKVNELCWLLVKSLLFSPRQFNKRVIISRRVDRIVCIFNTFPRIRETIDNGREEPLTLYFIITHLQRPFEVEIEWQWSLSNEFSSYLVCKSCKSF